jgi:hypothetical protein
VFVCVSTECLPEMPLAAAMERLAELEFTAVELDVREGGPHLQPARVAAQPEAVALMAKVTQRHVVTEYALLRTFDGVRGYSMAQGQ